MLEMVCAMDLPSLTSSLSFGTQLPIQASINVVSVLSQIKADECNSPIYR